MGTPVASPPVAEPQAVVARLRQARLAGRLKTAASEAMTALAGEGVTLEMAAEAARVLIAAGQATTAARLCHLLAAARPGSGPALETEATARLALLLGQADLLAGLPAVARTGWLARWQQGDGDLCPTLEIRNLKVAIVNGPILYTVTGACPWCGHVRDFSLRATLLVRLDGLCPACFGRYEVTWDALRAFIRRRFPALVADGADEADHDLIDHVRRRLLEDPTVPEIARALGQEYHFLLNELLARRHLAAAGRATGTGFADADVAGGQS